MFRIKVAPENELALARSGMGTLRLVKVNAVLHWEPFDGRLKTSIEAMHRFAGW